MKKLICLFFLLWVASYGVFAQSSGAVFSIKGQVLDSANAVPLAYVTIALRESGKTELLKSTYTKDNGEFFFSGLSPKPYEVVVTYVGYQEKILPVNSGKDTDLGKIKLGSVAGQLQEVEVKAQKLLITQDVDKISYDVEADPESKTETVLDMLRKVPLVTVDADDNIQLKGSGSYRVLINGKTSALFVRDPKEVLKSMPAGTIQKIEVITNPPAKYEAEGVGGIINIITNRKAPGGYNGSISGGIRTPTAYNGSAYLTVKTGKFGASANYGGNRWFSPENRSVFSRTELESNTRLQQNGKGKNDGLNQYGSAQVSFEFDSLNLLTGNVSFYQGSNDISRNQDVSLENGGQILQQYIREDFSDEYWQGHDIGLDYQRSFAGKPDQLLTFSYKYNLNNYGNLVDFKYLPLLNYFAQTGRTQNDSDEGEHTAQVDYVQPFRKHTLETGIKSISRLNRSTYFYALQDPETGEYKTDPSLTNDFDYHQDIYAAYLSLSLKRNDWGLKLGSRLEETKTNAFFKSSDTKAKQDYFNLIPSLAISRKLKESQDMKFSYTQRLERPGLWYLNPYVDRVDPKNISFGNPNVQAVISHNFELAHSVFIKTNSLNTSLYYNFTNNAIQQYSEPSPSDSTVLLTTYKNLGREQVAGLQLSANLTPVKPVTLNFNSSLNYYVLTGTIGSGNLKNKGATANVFGSGTYKFEKNWRLSGNIGFSTRGVMLQGRSGGYMWNSFSFGKNFLKDETASLNLTVNSPFQKYRSWKNDLQDPAFIQYQQTSFQSRRFGISFTYKFGKLEGDIARKKRGIENDDVKGGKSGGGN